MTSESDRIFRETMTEASDDLQGVRVLVTGGTSGLGHAMAAALAASGARVALSSRDASRAQRTAAELGAVGVEMDVRDERSVAVGVDSVYQQLGGLDVLVNNAGIGMRTVNPRFMTHPQSFWQVSPSGFRDVIETKMTGSFLVAREVAPRMLAAGSGRIIMISMNEQTMTRRGFVPYGPSGAGVEALARVMAQDLADTPVSVNILLPGGATATGMLPDDIPSELKQQVLKPEIMGPPIIWLCSDRAAGVHDQRIIANQFS
jgi:NAD(P)-dependent dehydrogenase (short-subunit alcohol dehydrogenase family)